MSTPVGLAPIGPAPRILVIGDVMTDVIVRPEGPLARGSDRRAAIAVEPGGSAANQAAWLASFGVSRRFRRPRRRGRRRGAKRRGSLDAGVTPRLVGDPRSPDRAARRADRPERRAQLLHRPRRERGARCRRHPRRADRRRLDDPSLRLFLLRPLAPRGGARRHAPRRRDAGQRRSGLGGILARGRAGKLSRMDAGRGDPVPQRRRGGDVWPARTTRRPNARGSPRAIRSSSSSAARPAARRRRARGAGGSKAPRVEAIDTPAPATPSSPRFSPRGSQGAEVQAALERAVAAGAAASTVVGGRPKRARSIGPADRNVQPG